MTVVLRSEGAQEPWVSLWSTSHKAQEQEVFGNKYKHTVIENQSRPGRTDF